MYDVAIVGAGVTGCAIARELARYRLKVCVIERNEDVGAGTSKANSAIVHAGFDAKPGSLKAKFNVAGSKQMEALSEELDFPYRKNGSLVVCLKGEDPAMLDRLKEQGIQNGVEGLQILGKAALNQLEPNLSSEVECALYAPTGGIVCPFLLTVALAENAADNGVSFYLNTEVTELSREENYYHIKIKDRGAKKTSGDIPPAAIDATVVVNAAGVYADELHNMVCEKKLHIMPRRGQYMLLDKTAGSHVRHTIFCLPSRMGKGVLVTQTVHGNLLIGPTAEDILDKEETATTADGLSEIAKSASRSVGNLPLSSVITSFSGLRAHEDGGDFVIGEQPSSPGFFDAAGIESPGLSAAPAIGKEIAQSIAEKLHAELNPDFKGKRSGILNPSGLTFEARNDLIRKNPAYGRIICRCESISEGEILDAIHRTLGARSLDGVKRRVRAGMGRCQAGFCSPRVMELLERELSLPPSAITKSGGISTFIEGKNKEDWGAGA